MNNGGWSFVVFIGDINSDASVGLHLLEEDKGKFHWTPVSDSGFAVKYKLILPKTKNSMLVIATVKNGKMKGLKINNK